MQCKFVYGKARLTPHPEPTIPKLKRCAAVLDVELILGEIDLKTDAVKFYCNRKVVLGLHLQREQAFLFTSTTVLRIWQTTSPKQWHYVPTDQNPDILATRSVTAPQLASTSWLTGPAFQRTLPPHYEESEPFELVSPELDAELRPQVTSFMTQTKESNLTLSASNVSLVGDLSLELWHIIAIWLSLSNLTRQELSTNARVGTTAKSHRLQESCLQVKT